MAMKKTGFQQKKGGRLKRIFFLCLLFGCGMALYWVRYYLGDFKKFVVSPDREEMIETFETCYSPETLLAHQTRLLPSKQHTFGPVNLLFSPYLFIQGKYSLDGRSSHATSMLWDLIAGELVLNTNTFDQTQGFADCLASQATIDDFRILYTISQKGPLLKQLIAKELCMNEALISERVESLQKRHLVMVTDDVVTLHVESPFFQVKPLTSITRPIVHRQTLHRTLIPSTYSKSNIEALVQAAFGPDFAIRSSRFIYIPTYEVSINNPDGSLRKTYWNGLTGKEMCGTATLSL